MAIVEDYAAIAAELRRIRRTGSLVENDPEQQHDHKNDPQHPMRQSTAGELLYRRLVLPRRR